MKDEAKTKKQLVAELAELRRQVAELKSRESEQTSVRPVEQNGEYLAVPIRKGEREFLAKDAKGKKWRVTTKTLNSQAKFERRYERIWH